MIPGVRQLRGHESELDAQPRRLLAPRLRLDVTTANDNIARITAIAAGCSLAFPTKKTFHILNKFMM